MTPDACFHTLELVNGRTSVAFSKLDSAAWSYLVVAAIAVCQHLDGRPPGTVVNRVHAVGGGVLHLNDLPHELDLMQFYAVHTVVVVTLTEASSHDLPDRQGHDRLAFAAVHL
jgi:hypothetical protein